MVAQQYSLFRSFPFSPALPVRRSLDLVLCFALSHPLTHSWKIPIISKLAYACTLATGNSLDVHCVSSLVPISIISLSHVAFTLLY